MEIKGKINNVYNKFSNNKIIIEIETDIQDISKINELKDDLLSIKFEKNEKKKSNKTNNYMWKLLDECSKKMQTNNIELYKKYVKEYGIYRDVVIDNPNINTLLHTWSKNGTAWFGEVLDFEDTKFKRVRLYYGTSVYNAKQMHRLLVALVEDARKIGVETKNDIELKTMLLEIDNKEI